ncbi:hypothetical protein K450DRAFT_242684 [Umbelopsis ramanniana AG]|uniref:PHD-type domain-containing protein n=1 Tax=Umbelopsis ramanniana AG TaxID=1314678 RepID=A0AAD5E9E7_UMBRA|nr:uncharacterized protein K450DRAFT_242684 [Umbelopsis ramanniana AG]KAI8579324.1 hypothetical protein K450DRAFT_242684 [Umbelopsis ramanniana AG]
MYSGDQWEIAQRENSASPMPSRNQLLSNHPAPTQPMKNSTKQADSAIQTPQPDANYQYETAAAYLLELSGKNNLRNNAEIDAITAQDGMNDQTNHYARQVSFSDKKNLYNNNDDQSIGSATASERTAASYGQSSVDDDKSPNHHEHSTPGAPLNNGKHARSRSKDFVEAYRRQRNQLAPAVIHIPRRHHPETSGNSHGYNSLRNRGASYDGEAQTVSSLLSAGHKMPPPGYNPEARYLRAIRQVPQSMGINAINRPQSVEIDQYETEDSEEDSDEVDDIDHFLNDSQKKPDDDPWLKKWKYDDPEVCCICLGEGAEQRNAFVYCDNPQCEVIVHQECYGIKKLPGPNDVWLCDRCKEQNENPAAVVSCAVCPSPHGAFRRLDKVHQYPGWIHVVCGTWMPNVQISDANAVIGFDIREIPEKSWNYKCFLCPDPVSASHGACVRCDAHGCKKTFHISCAQKFSLLEEAEESEKLADPYFTYCLDHSSYNQGEPKLNNWEKWVRQRDRYLVLKNEESAEQRSAALWNRAQSITKGNDHATSELIRAGFGFRELASDRYSFFAKEMADTISSSQSTVFQLEAENFQLEEAISKMDSNLKDTSHKIKRAEKRKVELQKEINKVKSLLAKEELAEKNRLELERMEDARLKKTVRVEKRKAELQKELSKVTAEIAQEDRGRKRKLSQPNDLSHTSTKRYRETSHSSSALPDHEFTGSSSPVSTRSKPATTFSFPPIISSLFGQYNHNSADAEQDELNSPTSASPNTTPSPTSGGAIESLPDNPTNEQSSSLEPTMPSIAHKSISPEADTTSLHNHNVHNRLSRVTGGSGHVSGLENHGNNSDAHKHSDHVETTRALSASSSPPRRLSSEQDNADREEVVEKAAKAAIVNGKMLLRKAQMTHSKSKFQNNESYGKEGKPERVLGLVETLNSVLGSPVEAGETITGDSELLETTADEELVETDLGDSTEINTDIIETEMLSNGRRLETTPTPPHLDQSITRSKSTEKRQSDASPPILWPPNIGPGDERFSTDVGSASLGEPSLSGVEAAAETYEKYRTFVRVSPFDPEQQVEISLQYTPWLSKYLRTDNADAYDSDGNDIVTEYIPVFDGEENIVPSVQHDDTKNGENKTTAGKRKRTSHKQPSVEPALPSRSASQNHRTVQVQETPMTTRSLSPRRSTMIRVPLVNQPIRPRIDAAEHDKEHPRTRSASPLMPRRPIPRLMPRPSSSTSSTNKINLRTQYEQNTKEASLSVRSEAASNNKKTVNGQKEVPKLDKQKGIHAPIKRAASDPKSSATPPPPSHPEAALPPKQRKGRSLAKKATTLPADDVCAECGKKEISLKIASELGVSAANMRHLISIRPTKKPGHTGQGKDWDPGVLVQCETCRNNYHCGCTDPPIRNYPERGVQFRCIECDVVKIIYPEVEEVRQMNRAQLKTDKKSLRERKRINYHE